MEPGQSSLRYIQTTESEGKVPGMSFWAVLLRVLLSVALIVNGATTAMASVQMAHGAASIAATPVKPASVETPCNEHQQTASVTADPPSSATVESPKSKHATSDCCKSGACRCACMQSASASLPMMMFTPALVEHSQSVRPMALGHAAPALPQLIRPPIG